jgi:hypothetical protein
MSNFDTLKEKIKDKINDKTTLKELIVEVDKIKETLNTILEMMRTRSF